MLKYIVTILLKQKKFLLSTQPERVQKHTFYASQTLRNVIINVLCCSRKQLERNTNSIELYTLLSFTLLNCILGKITIDI